MTGELGNLRAALRWMLLASGATVMVLLGQSKIGLDTASFAPVFGSISLLAVAAIVCARRGLLVSSLIMEVLAGGLAFSVLALIATYLSISLDFPLADELLVALDRSMGFDGAAFIRLVDANPALSNALMLAYQSFALQLMVLPILLILFGQAARGFVLVLAYALVCYVSSFISIWFPALGSHVMYGIDPASLASVNPHFGHAFLEQFNAVRDQPAFVLSIATAEGILTFPSVHAAVAFLCAASAFTVPLLRYPFLILNMGMATATVTHSNHYLIDVLAGFAVAAVSLGAVTAIAQIRPATSLAALQLNRARSGD